MTPRTTVYFLCALGGALGLAACGLQLQTAKQVTPATDDRLVFDVFFDFDKDDLSPVAKEHLAAIAEITRSYDNPVVTVLGNADQVGATDYNLALSERRAEAVAKELEANGVKLDAVVARGDQAPSVANPERRPEAMNRRALVVVREARPN